MAVTEKFQFHSSEKWKLAHPRCHKCIVAKPIGAKTRARSKALWHKLPASETFNAQVVKPPPPPCHGKVSRVSYARLCLSTCSGFELEN